MGCGENHESRKSGENVSSCRFFFMSIVFIYPQAGRLWISAVEKPVENVENYWFSTGISPVCPARPGCG